MKVYCTERVWDNGDMTDCGRIVFRLEVCERHFKNRIVYLKDKIAKTEDELNTLNNELRRFIDAY